MNDQTDQQLLRDYSERQTDAAFAELVRRHVDLVYSATLRMVRDAHLAEDVTQAVFIALAQDALDLTARPVLSGWLHRTAQNLAAKAVRTDVRRRAREQEAATMNELLADSGSGAGVSPAWSEIAPHLDAALGELSEPDRDAVLLRYFENKSLREVGQALGTSDDTAQKRVSRAVERLREFFAKRGVTVGASGLVIVISGNAVQAAPVGLAVTISTAAATATAIKTIAMTTLQKAIIGTALVAAVGTGIYEARQASVLRSQVQTLQQQQAAPTEQIQQLQNERDEATRQLASLREDNERLKRNPAELLKLRGEVGTLRRALAEASPHAVGNQTSNRGDDIHPEPTPTATTTDMNPVTRIDARFEISQLKEVGNASIEAAAQTALWSVFNRDEQGFDRIRYRDPDAPQMTAKDIQKRLEDLASRFAGATDVTITYWSKEGDNRRLAHFLAPCPDNNQSAYTPEGGTLVFQRAGTGWNLDQFVIQSRGISKPAK